MPPDIPGWLASWTIALHTCLRAQGYALGRKSSSTDIESLKSTKKSTYDKQHNSWWTRLLCFGQSTTLNLHHTHNSRDICSAQSNHNQVEEWVILFSIIHEIHSTASSTMLKKANWIGSVAWKKQIRLHVNVRTGGVVQCFPPLCCVYNNDTSIKHNAR